MMGNWEDGEEYGEMILIKIPDGNENLFGLWTACN